MENGVLLLERNMCVGAMFFCVYPCAVMSSLGGGVVALRDEVRAPIPQKQDILVEPEPLFGGKARPGLYLGGRMARV